jgi:hypothetical protein
MRSRDGNSLIAATPINNAGRPRRAPVCVVVTFHD